MIRIVHFLICVAVMFASCESKVSDSQVLELKKQQIGVSSVHNLRQLGDYRIGGKRVKDGLCFVVLNFQVCLRRIPPF